MSRRPTPARRHWHQWTETEATTVLGDFATAGLTPIGVKLLVTSIFRIGVDRLPESVDSSFSALLIGSAEMVEKPGERRRDVS